MSLCEWVPPQPDGVLDRNGFALVSDLEAGGYGSIIQAMEGFQAEFLALTRPLWCPDFPIPGDALAHFTRQWEYPYAWANIGPPGGRLLDAGSGLTFFPFLLAAAGFDVHCCDNDGGLGLGPRYQRAAALTGLPVEFTEANLTELPYPADTFDVVTCVSVIEHVGALRAEIVAAVAKVLRPGGRLVLTCDVDLRREGDLLHEDVAVLLAQLHASFVPVHALDLRRPANLLTSDYALSVTPWRLPWPWRPPIGGRDQQAGPWRDEFRSIAVLGVCAVKRG
jgi:2-polyprenyl-3-methyl-5-hydroxy-6-metoxy-1,4-benzoquinol methylase